MALRRVSSPLPLTLPATRSPWLATAMIWERSPPVGLWVFRRWPSQTCSLTTTVCADMVVKTCWTRILRALAKGCRTALPILSDVQYSLTTMNGVYLNDFILDLTIEIEHYDSTNSPFVGHLFTIPIWGFYAFVPPQLLLPYGSNPSSRDTRRAECPSHFSPSGVLHPALPLAW
jgi:hypothetical protein